MLSALIIGTGSIGERHLRCFQKSGLYSVSACEPNDTLRQEIATGARSTPNSRRHWLRDPLTSP